MKKVLLVTCKISNAIGIFSLSKIGLQAVFVLLALGMMSESAVAQTAMGASPYTVPATGNYTIPAGVSAITVKCWGGGGAGAAGGSSFQAGAGAAGAAFASSVVSVTGGTAAIVVGTGGQTAGAAGTASTFTYNTFTWVSAAFSASSTAGTAANSIGTTKFNGGARGKSASAGGNGVNGGAGGGGAGDAADGGAGYSPATTTGWSSPNPSPGGTGGSSGGGAGGNGPVSPSTGGNAAGGTGALGGGGGAGATGSGAIGKGGAGRVILIYTVCTNPTGTGSISGSTPVCKNTSANYTIAGISNVTAYSWSVTGGLNSVSAGNGTATATIAWGNTPGTFTVSSQPYNTTACSSAVVNYSVVVTALPNTPSAIVPPSPICNGGAGTYTVTQVAGMTYSWTVATLNGTTWTPNGSTTTTTNYLNVTAGSGSATINAWAVNSCGNPSASSSVGTFTPSPAPNAPTGFGIPSSPICAGTAKTYSVASQAGMTYNWALPAGWSPASVTGGSNTLSATPGNSGTFTVTATNACNITSSGLTQFITVDPPAPNTPAPITQY